MKNDKPEKNINNEIIMEQPDMIYRIGSYHSMKVNDGMISQIYSFRLDQENDCIINSIPDASIDFVMFKSIETDECGIELICPTKQSTSSYVRFQGNPVGSGFTAE